MASTALSRVTGVVLALPEPRRGLSKVTGEPWEIANANVLVANQNVTVVQLPRRDERGAMSSLASGAPARGDLVDFLVEFSVYGQEVQARVLGDWNEEDAA